MKFNRTILTSLLLSLTAAASAQVLYKVEGNGLSSPSFIFGTHHLAPLSKVQDFGAQEPFKSAEIVVGEIDMTGNQMELAAAMQPHMMAPADSTISKLVTPDDYTALNKEFEKWAPMPGMTLQMVDMLKPMAVTSMITVGMISKNMPDYNANEQLDTWFQTQGKADGKKIIPLETADFQASVLFDSTPIAYQIDALVDVLKNPQKSIDQAMALNKAYDDQDLQGMLKMTEEDDEHPEFMIALLDRRNADWLSKLPDIMKQGSSFIAVGALHLAGSKGLVEGLRSMGYTVTPLSR